MDARSKYFERAFCINLDRREDRWVAFQERVSKTPDWPFPDVERWRAHDGKLSGPPPWWKQGAGAWGCAQSHIRLLEEAMHQGWTSYLVFEDDAFFCDDFATVAREFLDKVPADWDQVYLGGQHLGRARYAPQPINDKVQRAGNINRTHAFAISCKYYKKLYQFLVDYNDWMRHRAHHIDHRLGMGHQKRMGNVYVPKSWPVGQIAGVSDISGRDFQSRFWDSTEVPADAKRPFVAVMGLHRSGSSCLAGVLHSLGVHMGNRLMGYEKRNKGGFEAHGLSQICENAYPFPAIKRRDPRHVTVRKLSRWVRDRQSEAQHRGTLAGGKYPHLCAMGDELRESVEGNLYVISIERPLRHSIDSLVTRSDAAPSTSFLHISNQQVEAVQRWLWSARESFLLSHPKEHLLRVNYYDLLQDPEYMVNKIIEFLGLKVTVGPIERAIQLVDPKCRKHGLEIVDV